MYEAGKTDENPNAKGLALLINKNFIDCVENLKSIQTESSHSKLNYTEEKKPSRQFIQVYAPTCDHDNETVEMFYEELEKAIDTKACGHHIVMGDFNAKIGVRNINDNMKCTGPLEKATEMREGKDSWTLLKKTTW